MRKYILSLLFLVIASIVSAQQKVNIKVWKGGKAEIIEQIDSVTFPKYYATSYLYRLRIECKMGIL